MPIAAVGLVALGDMAFAAAIPSVLTEVATTSSLVGAEVGSARLLEFGADTSNILAGIDASTATLADGVTAGALSEGISATQAGLGETVANTASPLIESTVANTANTLTPSLADGTTGNILNPANEALANTQADAVLKASGVGQAPVIDPTATLPDSYVPPETATNYPTNGDGLNGEGAGNSGITETGIPKTNSITSAIQAASKAIKDNPLASVLGANMIGGMFDKQKTAQANLLATQNQNLQNQMVNGSAIPNISNLQVNPNQNIYGNTSAPTFYAPRVGLINRTGR